MKTSDERQARERLEARLDLARDYFRQHHARVEPDLEFADRVVRRLRREPAEVLGWAAMRLLPATLALAALLAWFAFEPSAMGESVEQPAAPSDDLISWVLDGPETSP